MAIAINLERCVGCNTCANACKMQNNIPMGMLYNRVVTDGVGHGGRRDGRLPEPHPHVHPRACQHCENPACLKVCPTGATYKDDKGRVEIHYDKCIGCRICMAACPYNARVFNWNEPVRDPNWNYGDYAVPVRPRASPRSARCARSAPTAATSPCACACVPARARTFGDLDDPDPTSRRSRARTTATHQLLEEFGTRPQLRYYND